MRLLLAPSTVLCVLVAVLAPSPAAAGPFSKIGELVQQDSAKLSQDDLALQNSSTLQDSSTLGKRSGCSAGGFSCGYYGQLCCVSGTQTCATNAQNQAYCADTGAGTVTVTAGAGAGSGSGAWQYYTSTWVTTGLVTMTSVYSSWVPAQATTIAGAGTGTGSTQCKPNYANNESPCGPICCSSGQYCYDASAGLCKPAGNGGFTTTGVANAPPTRPTTMSNGVIVTLTMTPTTTIPFGTPIATGASGTLVPASSGGGLSGGAIAGIVIGVLAGIGLLILLCLCCCLKAGFDGILGLLGLGGRNRRTRVEEEEFYESRRRYGSAAGASGRMYGSGRPGPPRPRPPPPPPKKEGIGGLGAVGLGLGTLAVALGLKRKADRRHDEKSDVSSSYYDYYTYDGSSSSDSRTRRSSRH